MATKLFFKEVMGNPVTDSKGKQIQFTPAGGDTGYIELDEVNDAAYISELSALVGRFGIYAGTQETLDTLKKSGLWMPSPNPSNTPLRVLETAQDRSKQPVAPVAADGSGSGVLVKPSMPREAGFPVQPPKPAAAPAGEVAPALPPDFKPKTGSPKRKQSVLPTDAPQAATVT